MIKKIKILLFLTIIFFPNISHSLIEVDITRGNLNPLPIAVSPLFSDENTKKQGKKNLKLTDIGSEISKIVENNLSRSGLFNPLDRNETLPTAYSQGSTVLNIDTTALAAQAQGDFFGYLPVGTVVSGNSSGAQATISSLEVWSDPYGDVTACVWIRDPFASPTPLARVRSGEREFKVTSSSINAAGLRGSTAISSATVIFIFFLFPGRMRIFPPVLSIASDSSFG